MDKEFKNDLNDLKELSGLIDEARSCFNRIVVGVCNDVAEKLETSYISFDEVEVWQFDGFTNGINGYSATDEDFYCDDPNKPVPMKELTTKSIVKAMDTIIKTAKPDKGE